MRVSTSERLGRWAHRIGLASLVVLAWAVLAPGGAFWTAVVAAGVIGSAVATVLVVRSRKVPSLAQVVARAVREPAFGRGRREGKR
jgi:hypothetical protein